MENCHCYLFFYACGTWVLVLNLFRQICETTNQIGVALVYIHSALWLDWRAKYMYVRAEVYAYAGVYYGLIGNIIMITLHACWFLLQDYASVWQIRSALELSRIVPTFVLQYNSIFGGPPQSLIVPYKLLRAASTAQVLTLDSVNSTTATRELISVIQTAYNVRKSVNRRIYLYNYSVLFTLCHVMHGTWIHSSWCLLHSSNWAKFIIHVSKSI